MLKYILMVSLVLISINISTSFANEKHTGVISNNNTKIKAVAFDAFPIFDPRPAFKVVKEQFPEKGDKLRKLWFSKIFAYTWLRTSADKYKSFWLIMEDALEFSAESMKLDLTQQKKEVIMNSFLRLPVWPDVKPALDKLKTKNIRLAFLSNMSEKMLRANLKHNNIENYFEFVISTDKAKAFKPSPKAYQLGIDILGLQKEEIIFASFAGWDTAGSSWFGYPTFWVNRLGLSPEKLGLNNFVNGRNLNGLVDLITKQ